jgi:hypothetical protein
MEYRIVPMAATPPMPNVSVRIVAIVKLGDRPRARLAYRTDRTTLATLPATP